jgi:hypothetical protein
MREGGRGGSSSVREWISLTEAVMVGRMTGKTGIGLERQDGSVWCVL